jgi:signal transduction histidine kinase
MDNAAKYTHQAPKISLFLERINGYIQIKIQDNGVGIPRSDIEHIFQRFYRVNKTQSKKLGGSGLGLSIVETIVEKHFGTITVESEVGKGSTFTIKIKDVSTEQ